MKIYIIALRGVRASVCEGDYGVMTSAGVRAEPKKPFRHSDLHSGPSQTHTHTGFPCLKGGGGFRVGKGV